MNTASIVALVVVVLVVVGLAGFLLKGRKGRAEAPAALEPPPADAPLAAAAPVEGVVAGVQAAPCASPPSPVPPRATVRSPPSPAVSSPPPTTAPVTPSPPPGPVTVAPPRPRPQASVVERVLVLENVDASEWEAARPLTLSAVQRAAVASAMTAASQVRPGESGVHAVRFDAGTAIRIARGDVDVIRSVAAAYAAVTPKRARWLDSAAATALTATALAALASERWLDALGDEMRELKTRLAALPAKLSAQGEGRLKTLVQDLSRFAREARDNYVSVIGKFAFRECVGEGCERAAGVWHELVVVTDALRQQLDLVARAPRFGEVQVERTLACWRELLDQERLQEIAARVLAGMHTLRLALGDAAPGAGGVDPLASAAAAMQTGLDQDRDLAARLARREKGAKGDPYVGRAEFEAIRAALRKLLDKPVDEAIALAMSRLHAAAATAPLDTGAGAPSRLLVQSPPGEGMAALRWSSAPHSG
jgi:hypothetical protein